MPKRLGGKPCRGGSFQKARCFYLRNGREIALQSTQMGRTIVAPARAGFQKLRTAQLTNPPRDARKFFTAPVIFTSGDAGSNSLAITRNPTKTQSKASLNHPQRLIPNRRSKTCRLGFGSLPVFAAVSPRDSSAESVMPQATSLTISTWCGYGIEIPC